MTISIESVTVPLRVDEDGTVRVGGTRVILDLVIRAFQDGASPEEIVQAYDVLRLPDVYAVIAYYLQHQPEIDAYLAERDEEARRLRTEIEKHLTPPVTREELLPRKARRQA